jgi:fatty acid CoA ligase FadD21
MLHGRASLRPHDIAVTFTDYVQDSTGIAESLTWQQLSRRTLNVARELSIHASPGDRAVILAPQSLDYILAFLGAMQAGLIAVPLPLPRRDSNDDRVSAVLADTSPAVVVTTSAVAEDIAEYVGRGRMYPVPKVFAIDAIDAIDSSHVGDGVGDGVAGTTGRTADLPNVAYLQYSSGSTRLPTGVMISHRNLQANFDQLMRGYFADTPAKVRSNITFVSWLPFYHDMGLMLGVCAPILSGHRVELSSPISFLERPARWMRSLAATPHTFSAAPNFAFDLAARRTTDSDLAGMDLGRVVGIINGAERVEPASLRRFVDRFAHFNFRDHMVRPSYGLAEATVFVATCTWNESSEAVRFDVDGLSNGRVQRCSGHSTNTGTELVKYQLPQLPTLRIVDSDTNRECLHGLVGEIWVHGANVADGYWNKPPEEQRCFGAVLADPSPGTPDGPWLRTGDLGFISEDALFIVGRIKDLLIIRGRNHYPEDIEATVQGITGGRVAAISVPLNSTEKLVTVIEVKKRGDSTEDAMRWLTCVKSDVTSAISNAHGLNVGDLVLVSPGSIPTTTSGKIQRAACVEQYSHGQFTRLDA